MKTLLRIGLSIFTVVFLSNSTQAQCTVSDIIVQNISIIGASGTSCSVKFDVTFNIQANSGNKFIYIHAWIESQYPNYFNCVNGQSSSNGSIAAPRNGNLTNSFINIGLNNDGPLVIPLATYPPDATVPMNSMDSATKVVMPDGSANITLYGVVAVSPVPCTTPVVLVADLWSSQSANSQRAHCVNCGIRTTAGYLSVFGFVNCAANSYNGAITNNTGTAVNGYYRVFADVNNDGYFTPSTDTLLQTNTAFTVAGLGAIPLSGSLPPANAGQNIFVVITQTSGSAAGASRVFLFRSAACGPLPVTFSSIAASRMNQNSVLVKWTTATEVNTHGFMVQRREGDHAWTQSTFIASKSVGGSSSFPISYTFTDLNSTKGLTQYRIQQFDYDGKTNYSGISVVRGEGQNAKMVVYPNPSNNGRVMVVFDEQQVTRDISLVDMHGKQVKQWRGVVDNSLQMDNLLPGMYLLKVISKETGTQTNTKIMVSKY